MSSFYILSGMDETTIRRLNDLNRRFYERFSASFDATRGSAWQGWNRLIPHLSLPQNQLSVLDSGCGNGRFGVFLAEHFGADRLAYHGIDTSAALLESARASLSAVPNVTLEQRDLLYDPLPEGQYNCVALFGVLHHIPGNDRRQKLIHSLAERVAPGGILVFTAWRFMDFPRFREHIIGWNANLAGKVEAGDYLLDWQRDKETPRYCHDVDDVEFARLVASSGLILADDYRADGVTSDTNRYAVLRRPPQE